MAFRTIEISNPAELHVEKQQLLIIQEEGTVRIPLDDIIHITCSGPNIRVSTLALSKLNDCGITLLAVDEKYNASSITIPIKGYSRQSMVIHKQIDFMHSVGGRVIWRDIIQQKIENQRNALRLLGLGEQTVFDRLLDNLRLDNIDESEALAAKRYFQFLSPGLNRREETPLNSKLNYGYAVLRNSIIRSLVNKGFQPAIGLHHANQLNAFNLADDLIEPFRPIVDLIAVSIDGDSAFLGKKERIALANVLHTYCELDGKKEKVVLAIEDMINSLKDCMLLTSDVEEYSLLLPKLIPLEAMTKVEE